MKIALYWTVLAATLSLAACEPRIRHVNVSETAGGSHQPAVARTGGRDGYLHIVWNEDPPGVAEEPVVMYRRATRSHTSLSPTQPIVLGDASLCVGRPEIVATGSSIFVAFAHMPVIGNGCKVYVNGSSDEGNTFRTQPVIVSSAGNAIDKQIAADGSNVHVTWRTSGNEIAYSYSNDAGATFSSPLTITTSAGPAAPAIALADDAVLIVYCTDAGDSFVNVRPLGNPAGGSDESLVSASASGVCGGESASAFGGVQYVGWLQKNPSTNFTVRQRQGGSLGDAFSAPYVIDEFRSSRIVGGQRWAVAAHISSIGQSAFQLNLARKDFGGTDAFELPVLMLGAPPGMPESFELVATSGYIHVLFEQSSRLYHAYSDDGGGTYNPYPSSGTRQPTLTFDGTILRGNDPDLEAHAADRFVVYASEASIGTPSEIMLYTWRKR